MAARTRVIKARRSSTCPVCRRVILPSQLITPGPRGARWAHLSCDQAARDAADAIAARHGRPVDGVMRSL